MHAFSSATVPLARLPDRIRNGLMGWLTLVLVPIGVGLLLGMNWVLPRAR
jgi:hypothetical protein